MKYFLLLLPLLYTTVQAQQKESTVSVSCYVNPKLYMEAGVAAQISDKSGKVSCSGKYLSLYNQSENVFYYKRNNAWQSLKPQSKTVIIGTSENNASVSSSAAVYKLQVKYTTDVSGSVAAKIRTISAMNTQTDEIKKRELQGGNPKIADNTKQAAATKPKTTLNAANKPADSESEIKKNTAAKSGDRTSGENKQIAAKPKTTSAQNKPAQKTAQNKPQATSTKKLDPTRKTNPTSEENKQIAEKDKDRAVARTSPPTKSAQKNAGSGSSKTQKFKNSGMRTNTALGLRVDFGSDVTGIGPNIKQSLNKNLSLDAALIFFEKDVVGLGAQIEQNFLTRNAVGLSWYLGIGPQFLFHKNDDVAVALVPVGGLDYNIPNSALNLSLDWRPNFYISPATDVEVGRFGLSLRFVF